MCNGLKSEVISICHDITKYRRTFKKQIKGRIKHSKTKLSSQQDKEKRKGSDSVISKLDTSRVSLDNVNLDLNYYLNYNL